MWVSPRKSQPVGVSIERFDFFYTWLILRSKTVGKLVVEFFEFVKSFDFRNMVISIRSTEKYLTKSAKGWTIDIVCPMYTRNNDRLELMVQPDRRCITRTILRLKTHSKLETMQPGQSNPLCIARYLFHAFDI